MDDRTIWSNLRTTIMVLVGVMLFLIAASNYIAPSI